MTSAKQNLKYEFNKIKPIDYNKKKLVYNAQNSGDEPIEPPKNPATQQRNKRRRLQRKLKKLQVIDSLSDTNT